MVGGILGSMLQGAVFKTTRRLLSAIPLLFALSSDAATVGVGLFSLSPDPVYIKAGEMVYWVESDSDFAPYGISGSWGNIIVPGGVQFMSPGTFPYNAQSIFGGNWSGSVVVVPNSPPSVTITSPTNNSVFTAPATIVIEAEASDADPDDVWDVEFWVGVEMVDDVFTPPYATTVTNLPAGNYTLKAVAWDYSYATATNKVNITVINPGPITLTVSGFNAGKLELKASGLVPGKTNLLQFSTSVGMQTWLDISTNVAESATASFTNVASGDRRFFRLVQLP